MKNILQLFITALLLTTQFIMVKAQVPPHAFSYQAIARNATGAIMANKPLTLQFSIHDSTASGIIEYQEKQFPTTNEFGLFTADIGTGTVIRGTFDAITWGDYGGKYLQVEIDTNGGFADMGTAELLSVPYALYAGEAKLHLPYYGYISSTATAFDIESGGGNAISGTSTAQYASGVYGVNSDSKGYGVYGSTAYGAGVYGTANGTNGRAVYANALGSSAYAIYANATQSAGGVAGYFSSNSDITHPNVLITESENDFARLSFANSSGKFWTIAAYNSTDSTAERINFYNSSTGNIMSITGDGKVGIGTASPVAKLDIRGDESITGKLTKPTASSFDLLPFAMGFIDLDLNGNIYSATSYCNVSGYTITRRQRGEWCLTIPGMNPSTDKYICFANPGYSNAGLAAPLAVSISAPCSLGGNCTDCTNAFNVTMSTSGGLTDCAFSFIIYKVN